MFPNAIFPCVVFNDKYSQYFMFHGFMVYQLHMSVHILFLDILEKLEKVHTFYELIINLVSFA